MFWGSEGGDDFHGLAAGSAEFWILLPHLADDLRPPAPSPGLWPRAYPCTLGPGMARGVPGIEDHMKNITFNKKQYTLDEYGFLDKNP